MTNMLLKRISRMQTRELGTEWEMYSYFSDPLVSAVSVQKIKQLMTVVVLCASRKNAVLKAFFARDGDNAIWLEVLSYM